MQKYVLGFAISENKEKVALVIKNRPEHQKGLYNGIGGKIEQDENSFDAMQREFNEETGVNITKYHWNYLTYFSDYVYYRVNVFYTVTDEALKVKTMEDEEIILVDVKNIREVVKDKASNEFWNVFNHLMEKLDCPKV